MEAGIREPSCLLLMTWWQSAEIKHSDNFWHHIYTQVLQIRCFLGNKRRQSLSVILDVFTGNKEKSDKLHVVGKNGECAALGKLTDRLLMDYVVSPGRELAFIDGRLPDALCD